MATDARAIRIHEAIHPDWDTVKEWAKATFTKVKMNEVALCAATVTLAGAMVFALHKAMEHYIILGF
jgi:hypothetical protein